jgi:hypothetical protein
LILGVDKGLPVWGTSDEMDEILGREEDILRNPPREIRRSVHEDPFYQLGCDAARNAAEEGLQDFEDLYSIDRGLTHEQKVVIVRKQVLEGLGEDSGFEIVSIEIADV